MTTVSEGEFVIDKDHLFNGKNWDQVEQSSLRIPAESWARIKAFMLKMCKKTKRCGDLSKWNKKSKKLESKNPELSKESGAFTKQIQVVN